MSKTAFVALFGLGLLAASLPGSPAPERAPKPSLTVRGTVERVHDGDTCTVIVPVRMNVRMEGIDAPELTEEGGKASRAILRRWIDDEEVTLHVPFLGNDVGDSMSFGRVRGVIFHEGENINRRMVDNGFAEEAD